MLISLQGFSASLYLTSFHCRVVGGYISHYLLERARVVSQASEERNYHIFYMLCAGAPGDLYKKLRLQPPDKFRYLSKGCSQYFCTKESDRALGADRKSAEHAKRGPLSDPMLDDAKYFGKLDDGLKKLGMSDSVSGRLSKLNSQFTKIISPPRRTD